VVLLAAACERTSVERPPSSALPLAPSENVASTTPAPASAASPPPAPPKPVLPQAGELVALEVEGFAAAVVALPRRAADLPAPLLVATHGNYDRPSWQCEEWRAILEGAAFVLCPRGEPRPDSPGGDDIRFTYASNVVLERELGAGLVALRARYQAHLADGPIVYTGFSLGAIQGVKIAARHPDLYPRLVLIEGGQDAFTPELARAFAKGGGKRVLFLCGQKGCQHAANMASARLEAAGVGARVAVAPGLGHSYGGPMNAVAREHFAWVIEGDERWSRRVPVGDGGT
jgi:hypothetical protein